MQRRRSLPVSSTERHTPWTLNHSTRLLTDCTSAAESQFITDASIRTMHLHSAVTVEQPCHTMVRYLLRSACDHHPVFASCRLRHKCHLLVCSYWF